MRPLNAADFHQFDRSEAVYHAVRSAIQDGVLVSGDRVREAALATQLRVSRTPVREAIQRLIDERVLTAAPGKGALVTRLDRHQAIELYALREVLEGAAAAMAAVNARAHEIATLKALRG